jgi:pimeloyl-ACP methyl ester carboxylesterase
MPNANVNGVNIVYSEFGKDKNNKHILFIHGLGSSSIAWRDIPDALSAYFHTIAVDLVGFGASDKPEAADYTIKGLSRFIVDFVRKGIRLGRDEKISLVGHSLGGYIAAQVAIENKDIIDKLVLIDSSGMLSGPTPLLTQYLDAAMEINPLIRYDKVKRVLENMYASPSRLIPVVVDLFNYTIEKSGARHAFASSFHNSTTTHIESDKLKQVVGGIPCLIIWGEEDNVIPLDHVGKFTQYLKDAEVKKIEDAGHSPFVEKTAKVYEILRTFLIK